MYHMFSLFHPFILNESLGPLAVEINKAAPQVSYGYIPILQ